jgi:hypothetical protein
MYHLVRSWTLDVVNGSLSFSLIRLRRRWFNGYGVEIPRNQILPLPSLQTPSLFSSSTSSATLEVVTSSWTAGVPDLLC